MSETYATDNEGLKHIASALKSARRVKKLKYTSVTDKIRIREDYLRAMESGAFDELPGGVYTRSHLKTYAEFLGIESAPLLEELDKALGETPKEEPVSMAAEPYQSSFSPNPMIIGLSIAACFGLFWAWQHKPASPPPLSEQQQKVVELYTNPSPSVALVATADVQVRVVGKAGGEPLVSTLLHDGDTYFVPEGEEATLYAIPLPAVSIYVEGDQVTSLNNLETRGGGVVLNRDKLLANTTVQ